MLLETGLLNHLHMTLLLLKVNMDTLALEVSALNSMFLDALCVIPNLVV